MSCQKGKLTDLEDLGRRSNLNVFGIHEALNQSEGELRQKVVHGVFCEKLAFSCFFGARIHRNRLSGPSRLLMSQFQDFMENQIHLRNSN